MNVNFRIAGIAAIAILSATQTSADSAMKSFQICRDIRAELHELKTTDNCNSPVGFCSAGAIDGNFGLDGTTFFSVDGVAATAAEARALLPIPASTPSLRHAEL